MSAAPAWPEFALATVKDVVPAILTHPLTEGVARVPKVKDGKTYTMVSGVVISKGEFRANMKEMDEGAAVTGFAITSLFCTKAEVGAVTAVDFVMDPDTAAMFAAFANVTAAVRVFKSSA